MSDWRAVTLDEGLELLVDNRGKNPPYTDTGVPAVSGQNVGRAGRLDLATARFVSDETWAKWMPVPMQRHDVVMTSEAPLGRVAIVEDDAPIALTQRVFGMRGRAGILSSRYLYYALQTQAVQADLEGRATGTTVLGIRQPALRQVRVPAPAYAQQRAIAEVLGALDDKIAANTALAAASDEVFRAEYAALSSARIRVADVASSPRTGVDPSSVNPEELYVGLEHVGRRHMWLIDGGRAEDVSSTKSRFEARDILFGKLRPYFHKVVSAPADGICSTDILVVRAHDQHLSSVLLAALSSDAVIEAVVAASEGTRMPRTSWKDLATVEVRWPGPEIAERLSERLDDVREATLAVLSENRTLAATRDALLPQLMSGKLRVRDAERIAAEAGA